MVSRPEKHSLTLRGHRTSVTLEPEFWRAFREIARRRDTPLNSLAAEIDESRDPGTGLATAIRLFVLKDLQGAGRPSD
ncbi:MAG: ribbon-helix-helix domain-containing protein [Rhodobacteraceae bacterium]|nr:ribbon-helix-helix domain-containing protein [Paracoccaceae bacterium]